MGKKECLRHSARRREIKRRKQEEKGMKGQKIPQENEAWQVARDRRMTSTQEGAVPGCWASPSLVSSGVYFWARLWSFSIPPPPTFRWKTTQWRQWVFLIQQQEQPVSWEPSMWEKFWEGPNHSRERTTHGWWFTLSTKRDKSMFLPSSSNSRTGLSFPV